jgi:hypothetical protein
MMWAVMWIPGCVVRCALTMMPSRCAVTMGAEAAEAAAAELHDRSSRTARNLSSSGGFFAAGAEATGSELGEGAPMTARQPEPESAGDFAGRVHQMTLKEELLLGTGPSTPPHRGGEDSSMMMVVAMRRELESMSGDVERHVHEKAEAMHRVRELEMEKAEAMHRVRELEMELAEAPSEGTPPSLSRVGGEPRGRRGRGRLGMCLASAATQCGHAPEEPGGAGAADVMRRQQQQQQQQQQQLARGDDAVSAELTVSQGVQALREQLQWYQEQMADVDRGREQQHGQDADTDAAIQKHREDACMELLQQQVCMLPWWLFDGTLPGSPHSLCCNWGAPHIRKRRTSRRCRRYRWRRCGSWVRTKRLSSATWRRWRQRTPRCSGSSRPCACAALKHTMMMTHTGINSCGCIATLSIW